MSTPISRDDFVAYTGTDSIEFVPRKVRRSLSSSTASSVGSRQDALTGQTILTKEGNGIRDELSNLDDLRDKLNHLRNNSHVKIRKLSGKLKEDFDSLAQYVAWIYNTESYPSLYAEIQSYFSQDETYQPGTIGAYCGGCLSKKNNLLTRGCTVVCAGSIPPPYEDPEWNFCNDLVVWAVYDGHNYDFTILNEIEDLSDDKVIMFIDQDSMKTFPGFTDAEKKTLQDHGLNQIRLVNYNSDRDPPYQDVSNGFVAISDLPSRDPVSSSTSSVSSVSSSIGYTWWIVIIVIIILFLLFILYRRLGRSA